MSASIKEKQYECNDSEKPNDCFSTIKELQVTKLISTLNTIIDF